MPGDRIALRVEPPPRTPPSHRLEPHSVSHARQAHPGPLEERYTPSPARVLWKSGTRPVRPGSSVRAVYAQSDSGPLVHDQSDR